MTQFSSIGRRMKILLVIFLLLFCYLIYHMFTVQIVRHEELFAQAKKTYTAVNKTEGMRGEIFDCSGNLLVGNRPCGMIFIDPTETGKEDVCRKSSEKLARILNLPQAELYQVMTTRFKTVKGAEGPRQIQNRYVPILENIEYMEYERLRKEITQEKIRGVHFRTSFTRVYPKNQLLANILGFTDLDSNSIKPRSGLEKFYDKDIRSHSGKMQFERSRDGIPLPFGERKREGGDDGFSLYLTIREPIQSIVEEELDKLMLEHRPAAAYAVMVDPFTGNILAVAQRPTYNPNNRETMKVQGSVANRIAGFSYEPGSVMKPFAVAGAIDNGIVTPQTMVNCENGMWSYAGKKLKDSHKIGTVSVEEVICQSSNIGTAKIALLMGDPLLDQTLRSFGFGKKTMVPLRPETSGQYRPVHKWYKITPTRVSIGQGVAVSCLQLAQGYCMLANGGCPVQLRLVDRIVNTTTGKEEQLPFYRGKSVYKRPDTHAKMVKMLKSVTEPGGTASLAAVRGYFVAGKTGTAQKFVDGAYSHSKYTASFAGFVPADNPKFVLIITVDEPSTKAYYGGTVSGPYFRSISERTLQYLHVPPDLNFEEYDALFNAAKKRELDRKKKIWAKEAEERRLRQERKSGNSTAAVQTVKQKKRTSSGR